MSQKTTTNYDSCRDLNGRRLKTINEAQQVVEYLDQEEERKRKRGEDLAKKIEDGLKEPEVKKHRFDDTAFFEDHEKQVHGIKDAVAKGTFFCAIQVI